MKKSLLCLLFACLQIACISAQNTDTLTLPQKQIVLNNNRFAFDFLRVLHKFEKNKNFAFSPFSLSVGFAMAYSGARGKTEEEIQKVFYFDQNLTAFHQNFGEVLKNLKRHKGLPYELAIHNVAFVHNTYNIKQEFQNLLKQHYKADFVNVNFENLQTQKVINDWGEKHSKGMIKELLSQYKKNIKLLLANLTFFETEWMDAFSKDNTQTDVFFAGKENKKAQFMRKECDLVYQENDQYKLVGLPIQGIDEACSMIILMPENENILDSLALQPPQALLNFITEGKTFDVFGDVPYQIKAFLSLPTFEINYQIDPSTVLNKLGILNAFNQDKADFSGIADIGNGLFISVLEHNCKIIVNEKGVKASASTAVAMSERSIPSRKEIKINKPFLFFLRDDATQSILFVGKVGEPIAPK